MKETLKYIEILAHRESDLYTQTKMLEILAVIQKKYLLELETKLSRPKVYLAKCGIRVPKRQYLKLKYKY